MKKTFTAIAAMLAMVSCATLKNGTHTVDIVSINDVQGRWFNEPYTEGGKVRGSLEALSDSISRWHDKAGRTSLLIDAGDEFTGGDANFYYDYIDTLGPHAYPSMASLLGVNAIIPSQEDLNAPSWRRVSAQLKEQGISVIEGSDYKIFKLKGGIRVAVLGSCEALPAASAKKPALVILKSNGKQIPSNLTGIDVVLAAHDHRAYAKTSDSTCIIDGGSYARNFGHASVTLNVKHHKVASKHFDASAPSAGNSASCNGVSARFLPEFLAVKSFVNSKIGILSDDLSARRGYCGSSDYMNLYHSIALSYPGVDISFAAPLSIGGTIEKGDIHFYDIGERLYPFDNSIVVLRMTGDEVRRYLEESYANWVTSSDEHIFLLKEGKDLKTGKPKLNFAKSPANFDSAAGINYTVDITKPSGSRISISGMADGSAFSLSQTYNVAITSYRASGTGGLLKAAGINPRNLESRLVQNGPAFRTILYQYLQENPVLSPSLLSNPSVVGTWKFIPSDKASELIRKDIEEIF